MMVPFVDTHTHHLPEKGENIFSCIDLSSSVFFPMENEEKNFLFSLGIHPARTEQSSIKDLHILLEKHSSFAAIGECGIDKSIPVDMEKQKELFLQQAFLAEELQKPLIIHCVRAWDILYECAKKFPVKGRRWLIHSFRGSLTLAEDLLRHNFTLSLAPQMVKNMPERVKKMRQYPFLLETDDTKEELALLYSTASTLCHISMEGLKERNWELFCDFFRFSREKGRE
ncbi:MAG: TatD family hydrolase [Lentisphaeria bacterium]|nr:TatD family hydrolase [Lentisphaeria bacterium]